jgi:TRAP-type mannitol/chloroaromatic compound transport system permease small subunit
MKRIASWLHVIDKVSEYSGKIASFGMLLLIFVVVFEVVSRYIFQQPSMWAHETSAYIFGGMFLIGGAYGILAKAHVSMDVIYLRFSTRTRAIVDMATALLFFLFCGVLLWVGGQVAWNSIMNRELSGTPWAPPIYPLKATIAFAALLMLFQGLAKFVRDLITAYRGKATVWML